MSGGNLAARLGLQGARPSLAHRLKLEGAQAPEQQAPAPPELDQVAPQQPAPAAAAQPISKTESALRGAGDAASSGFGDEAAGFGAWLADKMSGSADTARTRGRGVDAPLDDRSSYEIERDRYRKENADAREANPYSYAAGEVGGTLLTAAAPGSGAVKGAKVAAPALKFLPRAAQALKTGALYGAVSGLGASEANLNRGDVEGAAEDTAVGAGVGALFAPVAGELTHQVATRGQPIVAWAKRTFGDQADKFLQRIGAAYGPDVAQRGQQLADAGSSEGARLRALAREGADPEVLDAQARKMTRGVDELQELGPKPVSGYEHDLARRGVDDEVITKHAQELQQKVSDIWESGDVIKWHEDIASKRPLVRKLMQIDQVDGGKAIGSADDMVSNTRKAMQEMTAYIHTGTPDRNLVDKLLKEISEYEMHAKVDTGTDSVSAANRYMAVDQVKREFQRALENVRARRDSPIIEQLDSLETDLREFLESPHTWGEGAAALQQIRNRGWAQRLVLEGKDANPRRLFLSDASGEKAMDPYRAKLIGDHGGLESIVRGAGEFAGEPNVFALREWADREATLLEALTNHIDPDPDLVKAAQRSRKLASEIEDVLDARGLEAEAAKRVGKVSKEGRELAARDNSPERVLMSNAGDHAPDPFFEKLSADPSKVRALLEQSGTLGNAGKERAARAWAEKQAQGLEQQALRDPALVERAARARAVADEVAHALELRGAEGAAARELEGVVAADPRAQSMGRRMAAGATNALALPGAGFVGGALLSDAEDPAGRLGDAAMGAAAGAGVKALGRRSRGGRVVGQLLEDFVAGAPKLGERAQEIQALERALHLDPSNAAARERLQDLAALRPAVDKLRAGKGAETVNVGQRGAALEQGVRRGSGAVARDTIDERSSPSAEVELALQDPKHGRLLRAKRPSERAVAVWMLKQTDPEFSARLRGLQEQEPTTEE